MKIYKIYIYKTNNTKDLNIFVYICEIIEAINRNTRNTNNLFPIKKYKLSLQNNERISKLTLYSLKEFKLVCKALNIKYQGNKNEYKKYLHKK